MPGMFRNRWWVVFASACGLLVGTGAINVFAFGVFLKPITADLGIGRGEFTSAMALNSAVNALSCPIVGWLVDRYGVRRVMIPGILLCALATASYGLILASPFLVTYLIFALAGLAFGCQNPITYGTTISHWFDRRRGVALGIAMAGVGLGVALVPQLAALLIVRLGWRLAFLGLGIAVLACAFLPVALFVREPPGLAGRVDRQRAGALAAILPGIAFGETMRSRLFWALTLAFFLDVLAINGTITHVVALLTDRGLPLQVATGTLSATGLALILGRILSGWFLDRFRGPYVAAAFFVVPMIGILLLASGAGGAAPFLGAVACGIGIGAEIDLMAFFVSRYFGLRDYAKIYGVMFGIFSLGTGIGPALSGMSFDRFHSYAPIFAVYVVLLAATCVVFLRLGPYPFPPREPAPRGAEQGAPA